MVCQLPLASDWQRQASNTNAAARPAPVAEQLEDTPGQRPTSDHQAVPSAPGTIIPAKYQSQTAGPPEFSNPSHSRLRSASVSRGEERWHPEETAWIGPGAASCAAYPQQGSTKTGSPPPAPPRKPGSLFLSLGPLFPQSHSRKAGSSWLRGVELRFPQASSCHSAHSSPARPDSRVRGGTGMREGGTGDQCSEVMARAPTGVPPEASRSGLQDRELPTPSPQSRCSPRPSLLHPVQVG